MVIFLDTYAIIEIYNGNLNYKNYILDPIEAITALLNLIEVYFIYFKGFNEEEANKIYDKVKSLVIPINDSIIKEAMKFKIMHQKVRYSMADCIGYITALKFNAKFLTGDYTFKGLEGVEFIK